jgi:hypothetical protein
VIFVSSDICIANPYQSQRKAITYGLTQTADGYVLQVTMPKGHVAFSDRLKIINWLQEYRNQVIHTNPMWCANFRQMENGYILEIKPMTGPRQIACEGDRVRELWQRTLNYV